MSLTNPSPLPASAEPGAGLGPVAVPSPPGKPRKPGAALTAGLCFVAALVTAALMWALANRGVDSSAASGSGSQFRLAVAESGELLKSLRVGGTVETLNFAAIRAPQLRGPRDSGRADLTLMNLAEAGTIVEPGAVVAEFELRWLVDHIADREAVTVSSRALVQKERAQVMILKETERQARANAKAELEKARLDVRTAEVRSQIEAEVLENVAEQAGATLEQLQDEGRIKEAVHAADIRKRELQVREDELHTDRHLRDLERLRVKAPIRGMVVLETLFNRSGQFSQTKDGDQVYPGALFMRIVDTSQMVVSATVNQVDAQSIRIGDTAVVELDAYPGERFNARVVGVGAVAGGSSGGSRYSRGSGGAFVKHIPVRVLIEGGDERILPDLSASVDVHASARPKGVLVPREALQSPHGERSNYVYVHRDGEFLRRDVSVEGVSDTQAVLGAGLEAGEEILLSGLPAELAGYQ